MDELPLTKKLYIDIVQWMETKYSVTTIKQRRSYLKKMFKQYIVLNRETMQSIYRTFKHPQDKACFVMLNEYCLQNNIDFYVRIPKMKYKKPRQPEILSLSEIELMIECVPKPYDLCIRCIFNMGAGLRISEVIKLSWNHFRWIDWLRNQQSYGVLVIKQGKGGKDRLVNVPPKLMKDLYEYAKEKDVLNEFRIPNGSMIFQFGSLNKYVTKGKKRLMENVDNIDEQWKAEYIKIKYDWFVYNILKKHVCKALNKKIHIHQLRHSRSTYLYEYENMDLPAIQKLLGHSSIETTMRYIKPNLKKILDSTQNVREI
jgi:integrase